MTTENYNKIKALLKDTMSAEETMGQVKAGGTQKVWSWGARKFTNVENKGLIFRVNGFKHKGYVLITLAFDDTYTVYLLNIKCNTVKTMENVYCDELTDKIDHAVEKVDNYDETVKKKYNWK